MDLNKARRLAIEGTRERARDRLTELCMLDDDEIRRLFHPVDILDENCRPEFLMADRYARIPLCLGDTWDHIAASFRAAIIGPCGDLPHTIDRESDLGLEFDLCPGHAPALCDLIDHANST